MTVNVEPRRFTVEEYAKMGEAGIFRPGERVELIEGEIVDSETSFEVSELVGNGPR